KGADSLNLYQVYVYPGLCGNTGYSQTYTYTDISPNKTAPNFYEVLIPPGDYSQMLKVNSAANYSNLLIFPQPAQDVLNITIANLVSYYYEMTIFDRFGRKQGFASGNASGAITLNLSSFEEGVYIFYIIDGSGNAYRGKFIKMPPY
ncbi:MAG: T9SS type A sorting domain-containing protein, partial [Bacteroidia bacterium]